MRFLADMGVAAGIVIWLRQQGHDAVHLREEQLQRLPDREVFDKARSEQRVVLTFDLDFGEIAALSGDDPASIIVLRLRNTRTQRVIDRLGAVLPETEVSLEKGAVVVVEEGRHRIREFPIRPRPS